ncbi:hypothetical protein KI387_029299, partial [Taxus chinensis]
LRGKEKRMVPDRLAVKVVVVEEKDVIDWCDKCFMPHAPCEEDQEEEEESDDDNDDDVNKLIIRGNFN